jgi:hypothetical protein
MKRSLVAVIVGTVGLLAGIAVAAAPSAPKPKAKTAKVAKLGPGDSRNFTATAPTDPLSIQMLSLRIQKAVGDGGANVTFMVSDCAVLTGVDGGAVPPSVRDCAVGQGSLSATDPNVAAVLQDALNIWTQNAPY